MKTIFRILGVGALLALSAPFNVLAQQEPIIAVDITRIAVDAGSGAVIDVALTSGGSGYVTAPTVTVSGGGGVGATLTATISGGVVTKLTIVDGGTGYTSFPTISLTAPGATATATATAIAGLVESIAVNDPGSGYSSTTPPLVKIIGVGTGATATATVSGGVVTGITVTGKGTGYTSQTTVTIDPPAQATAFVNGLGKLFLQPEQNESYGPVGAFFNMVAEARGLFPVGGYSYQFFVNGVALASSVNVQPPGGGPGIVGWAPPQPGAYVLTVVASGAGHTATSLPVRYFATGTAMIAPTDFTLVPNGSSVVVQATATPPPSPSGSTAFVSRMEFYVDDAPTPAGTDTTYPYSFIFTPAPSPTRHKIEARAFDNNGVQISPNGTRMAIRYVDMVNPTGTPPVVRIVNPPTEGNVQAGAAATLIADATAPDGFIRKVEFYVNGVLLSAAQTFPFTATWTPQVPGRYQFVAVAFDDKSNAVASEPIMLTATGSFPTVSIIDPDRSGLTVVQNSTLPVTVRAAGPDGGITSLKSVEFLVDGVVNDSLPKGSPTTTTVGGVTTTTTPVLTEPFVFNWRSNVAIGTHRLSARVTSVNNLIISSSDTTVNVVANQPPQVALIAPTATSTVTVNVPTTIIAVPADPDGTIEKVEFFVNSLSIGSATKSPFQVSWTATTAGTYNLTAKATDDSGAIVTSESVSIIVDPPTPSGPAESTIAHTVFRGDFGSMAENGRFALAVNRNNRGTFIAFSTVPTGRSYLWSDITINPDGTFAVRDASNQLVLSGQTSATGVSGTFGGKTFIGPITPAGTFSPLLVTGTLTGVPNSQAVAIVGGDGTVTLYTASGTGREAGTDFLTTAGTYSFAAPTGGRFSGTVANGVGLVSGSVSGTVTGTFLLRQQVSRISNISTRALAGSGDRTLVAGFVVSGTGSKPLLVRAVGPTLANFGVANPLADPTLNLVSRTSVSLASNNDWGNSAALAALGTQVGAFPLTAGSRDAAVQASITPGMYSAVVGGGATVGSALIEIYDADLSTTVTSRITNISTRGQVGAGEALIAGFVITGDVRKKLLIRAVGPTLTAFGLTAVLADPKIDVLGGTTVIASNNDWTETTSFAQVSATSPVVGAFPLNAGSKDAALVLQLTPGSYTVQITGAGTSAGTVLVEIYDADL